MYPYQQSACGFKFPKLWNQTCLLLPYKLLLIWEYGEVSVFINNYCEETP